MRPDRFTLFLWWLAGASPRDLAQLPARTRLQYAALGLVVAIGGFVLAAVWVKLGVNYVGAIGVLVPGLAVPALVIALDRVIALQPRRLHGALAGFDFGAPPPRRPEIAARIAFAVAFSALTAFTWMLTESASTIRTLQAEAAARSNAPIRAEYRAAIERRYAVLSSNVEHALTGLEREQRRLDDEIGAMQATATVAAASAGSAADEQAREAGGIDGRLQGRGPRFEAQRAIAERHREVAATAERKRAVALEARERVFAETSRLRETQARLTERQAAEIAGLEALVRADPRAVRPASGLFADAAVFVALLDHPVEGKARRMLTALLFFVLCALECAPLLALGLNPGSPLDVLRAHGNRRAASAIRIANDDLQRLPGKPWRSPGLG